MFLISKKSQVQEHKIKYNLLMLKEKQNKTKETNKLNNGTVSKL